MTITGGSYKSIYGFGMAVNEGSVATVLGGTIQGGQYGRGMSVAVDVEEDGAVATVCDGIIQGGTNFGWGWSGVFVEDERATVRIAGGMMIGGNNTAGAPWLGGYGLFNLGGGDVTITGGTFKGGFYSTSDDQANSLGFSCGNTSIYGGIYEGNWAFNKGFCDIYTKVYGKDLVLKDNHLVGTLCDGNPIDVKILILGEPITVNIENNCASFPEFEECGGKGGKSGKKTKNSLFRP